MYSQTPLIFLLALAVVGTLAHASQGTVNVPLDTSRISQMPKRNNLQSRSDRGYYHRTASNGAEKFFEDVIYGQESSLSTPSHFPPPQQHDAGRPVGDQYEEPYMPQSVRDFGHYISHGRPGEVGATAPPTSSSGPPPTRPPPDAPSRSSRGRY